ncbi:MAG: hypothetical protein MI724_13105 [Spirochaetales bacterium]|nr:hypothetical protein [Spirochaetales bacterium]
MSPIDAASAARRDDLRMTIEERRHTRRREAKHHCPWKDAFCEAILPTALVFSIEYHAP